MALWTRRSSSVVLTAADTKYDDMLWYSRTRRKQEAAWTLSLGVVVLLGVVGHGQLRPSRPRRLATVVCTTRPLSSIHPNRSAFGDKCVMGMHK